MSDMTAAGDLPADYPGERLGLPAEGARSIARLGRRIAAVCIDWALALGISYMLFGGNSWAILGIFAVLQIVSIATFSGGIGHLLLGMRVVPVVPAPIGLLKPVIRTILLCVVIPAVIWDRDNRGLHDRLAKTILVRR